MKCQCQIFWSKKCLKLENCWVQIIKQKATTLLKMFNSEVLFSNPNISKIVLTMLVQYFSTYTSEYTLDLKEYSTNQEYFLLSRVMVINETFL